MSNEESKNDVVQEARELLRWAAPGPWHWTLSYEMPSGRKHWALTNAESTALGRVIDASLVLQHTRPQWLDVDCPTLANWQLIARAPELLSALCDEVERLQGERDGLDAAVAVQAESIETFQSQSRVMKEAIEAALAFTRMIRQTADHPNVERRADKVVAQLDAALNPQPQEKK